MQGVLRNIISSKNLGIFTILLFLVNFVSKILKEVFSIRIFAYPSTALKLTTVLVLLVYFFMYLRTDKYAKYIYVLFIIFGIDILIKVTQDAPLDLIYNRLYFFLKGLFFLLFVVAIKNLKKEDLEKIVNVLFTIGKLNLLLIVLGTLFYINIFKSYPNTDRFGYNGIIAEPGISSYFYILLATVSYLRYRYQNHSYWTTILMLLATVFLGTKSGYLFIGILGLMHILFLLGKPKYQISFISILVIVGFVLKDILIQFTIKSFNFGTYLYEKHGLITFITSKRDLLLQETIVYIDENWSALNYIIGGMDFKIHRVEFEFVDIFLFFGIAGVFVYVMLLKKIFLPNRQKLPYVVLFLAVLLVSSLGGNLFFSITNSFCFTVVFLYLSKSMSTDNVI